MGRLQVLIVHPALDQDVPLMTTSLAGRPCDVSILTTFHEARERLTARPPDLLITALKLQAYNGLHLVLLARGRSDRTVAVVLADDNDERLRAEAESLGALFVIKSLARQQVETIVDELLSRC
jgi:DNA-binding response OmpR family regulator